MTYKIFSFALIITVLSSCSYIQKRRNIQNPKTDKKEFIEQIKKVDCNDEDRLREVEKLYKNIGANEAEIELEKFYNVTNVVLTVKGKSHETIVVGGHYDKTTLGCGAIDNWTGVVIVANLYRIFKKRNNQKTYKFIAFGKEELNLVGSKAMVDRITETDRKNYCAMINFDSFGFTDIWTLASISDKSLIDFGREIAAKRNESFEIKDFRGASSDSKSFRDAKIPAITLSGLGDDWRDFLHQDKDQIKNINFDKTFENYQFAYQMLSEIDSKPCEYFR